jgi:hypothetical protein
MVHTFSRAWKEALWDRFYTGAPQRQRRSVERYNIVKRAGFAVPVAYAGDDSLAQTTSETRRDALLLQSIVGQSNWDVLDVDELARRAEALAADASTPYQLLRLTQIEAKLKADGVQRLLEDLRLRKPHASLWGSTFDYAWLNSALDEAAIRDPEVRGFIGSTHSSYVDDFKDLDSSRLKVATERVRRLHAERTIAAMNAHPEQEQLIKQEAAKTRRHKPLRYLFKEACEVLTAVCPCWMATHEIPPRRPSSRAEEVPANAPELTLRAMLERAGLHGFTPQHQIAEPILNAPYSAKRHFTSVTKHADGSRFHKGPLQSP